ARQVQGRERLAAHGVEGGNRIGGGDLPGEVGIVDDGREEIARLNECNLVRETVDPRVVGCLRSDEEIRVIRLGQITQDLRERWWSVVLRSPRAGEVFCQPFVLTGNCHHDHPGTRTAKSCDFAVTSELSYGSGSGFSWGLTL